MPSQRQDRIQEKDNACSAAAATDRCDVRQCRHFCFINYLQSFARCAGIREEQRDLVQFYVLLNTRRWSWDGPDYSVQSQF